MQFAKQYYGALNRAAAGPPAGLPFIFTVKTDNLATGSSANNQYRLPLKSAGIFNFLVNWGDGAEDIITAWDQAENLHTYAAIGTYTITITGNCVGFGGLTSDRLKLINIAQWGGVQFLDVSVFTSGTFGQYSNLNVTASDAPNFSNTTQQAGFFYLCGGLVGTSAFNNWDVSTLTNIEGFFRNASNFNQNIGNWNVSNVTNFFGVFAVTNFNQNISAWNVGNGQNFAEMFRQNAAFNQNISAWNMASATDLRGMFWTANGFNQPIGSWNVSNVTNFRQMFFFKGGLTASLDAWNVSSGADFFQMFYGSNYNQPLNSWDMASATNVSEMFRSAAFNQNIGGWALSAVSNISNFMLGKTPANFSAANLDAIYNGWTNAPLLGGLTTNFGTIKHTSAGVEGRALLTRANATVNVSSATNNGVGLIRITTAAAHGRSTGQKIFISGVGGTAEANGGWLITVVDATTFDLNASAFVNAYTSGGVVRTGYGWTITDGGL